MSSAPDVSTVNETLGKRKGSGTRSRYLLRLALWVQRLLLTKSPVPCVTDNQYTLDLYKTETETACGVTRLCLWYSQFCPRPLSGRVLGKEAADPALR